MQPCPPCLQRIFCSSFWQRMLLLYTGIEMKTFAFWPVFRRRRWTWRLRFAGARSMVCRICSFIHPPPLSSANVRQHHCLILQWWKDGMVLLLYLRQNWYNIVLRIITNYVLGKRLTLLNNNEVKKNKSLIWSLLSSLVFKTHLLASEISLHGCP